MEPQLTLFKKFVELTQRKRELEQELDVVKKELGSQKDVLMPMFEEDPRLRVSVDGMTVFLKRSFAAKIREGVERARAAEMVGAWLPELVKLDFNLNTLSAFMRERIREGGKEDFEAEMPDAVSECLEVREWFDIGACISG